MLTFSLAVRIEVIYRLFLYNICLAMQPCNCRALLPRIQLKYENCIKLQLCYDKRRILVADLMLTMKERGKYPAIGQQRFNHGHTSYNKIPITMITWTQCHHCSFAISTKPPGAKEKTKTISKNVGCSDRRQL